MTRSQTVYIAPERISSHTILTDVRNQGRGGASIEAPDTTRAQGLHETVHGPLRIEVRGRLHLHLERVKRMPRVHARNATKHPCGAANIDASEKGEGFVVGT